MNRKNVIIIILILLILFFITKNNNKRYKGGKNKEIVYIPNFLTNKEFNRILALENNKKGFKFEKFRYVKPLEDKFVYDIFYSKQKMKLLKKELNTTSLMKSDFPIEHRIYAKDSPGMDWHKDLLMYEKPQYEAIYTIKNESESLTEWIDERDNHQYQWTEPNSLLLVRASGLKHHVTPPISGEREILKLIYTVTNQYNQNYIRELRRFKI